LVAVVAVATVPPVVARVPDVGSVTLVEPVVVNVTALVAVNVITCPPASVMLLVLNVLEALQVNVTPFPMVSVPVEGVTVIVAVTPVPAEFVTHILLTVVDIGGR
jgi:hypothetical protein